MRLKINLLKGDIMKKLIKKDLNQNICLSNGNHKLSNNDKYNFYIFNLPSLITCPYATDICKKKCYSKYPEFMFESVRMSRNNNLDESKKDTFVNDMIDHITYILNSKKNKDKQIIFRLHESGDFYSQEYVNKWIKIVSSFEDKPIIFQAYTKSIDFFRDINTDDINIKIIFSIMPDTEKEYIDIAKQKNLCTFELISRDTKDEFNGFICKGICNECMACYKGKCSQIGVHEHGAGIKSKNKHCLSNSKFNGYKDSEYWKNYNKNKKIK